MEEVGVPDVVTAKLALGHLPQAVTEDSAWSFSNFPVILWGFLLLADKPNPNHAFSGLWYDRSSPNQPPPNQPARFSPTLSVCSYKDAHGAQILGGDGDALGHLHVYSHQLGCLFTGSQLCFFPNPLLTIITKFN